MNAFSWIGEARSACEPNEQSVTAITTSLLQRGYIEFVGFHPSGEPRYRVTAKGFDALRRAQRRP